MVITRFQHSCNAAELQDAVRKGRLVIRSSREQLSNRAASGSKSWYFWHASITVEFYLAEMRAFIPHRGVFMYAKDFELHSIVELYR